MTISERIEAGQRENRVLQRVSRAAWRLEQAERERVWALVSARAEGVSIRTLAKAAGLSSSGQCNESGLPDPREATTASVAQRQVHARPFHNALIGSLVAYEALRYLTRLRAAEGGGCERRPGPHVRPDPDLGTLRRIPRLPGLLPSPAEQPLWSTRSGVG